MCLQGATGPQVTTGLQPPITSAPWRPWPPPAGRGTITHMALEVLLQHSQRCAQVIPPAACCVQLRTPCTHACHPPCPQLRRPAVCSCGTKTQLDQLETRQRSWERTRMHNKGHRDPFDTMQPLKIFRAAVSGLPLALAACPLMRQV